MPTRKLSSFLMALFLLVVAISVFAYGPVPPSVSPDNVYAKAGYLDATLYGADKTGQSDSTAALIRALDDGYNYGLAVMLPRGTYLVSDTLYRRQIHEVSLCSEKLNFTPNAINKSPMLVGESGGQRPVIKLKDNAPGFNDSANPKPVVHFHSYQTQDGKELPWNKEAPCAFGLIFRGIDIDLGSGNAGAVGVMMPSAQYSTIEDVKVTATGTFYAGLMRIPSTNVVMNVEVEGGAYGIRPETCCGISLVGIKLRNQTVAGLYLNNYGATMVTGFDIEEAPPANAIVNTQYQSQTSEIALLDGVIRMSGSSPSAAILNKPTHTLWVSNVYVTTAGAVIRNNDTTAVAGGGTKAIAEYSFTNATAQSFPSVAFTTTSYTLINGNTSQAPVTNVSSVDASEIPTNLVQRHLIGTVPWFADAGVVNVESYGAKGDGVTDSTAAIQAAINASDYVFLPRGDYLLSNTLQLKANTHLFGVYGMRSRFSGDGWNPGGQFTPFIRSTSGASDAPYLGDIRVLLPKSLPSSYLEAFDWQAGGRSVVRQVAVTGVYEYETCQSENPPCQSAARKMVRIHGNGGGRWYGLTMAQDRARRANADFRGIFVDHTSQPLTFYGPNPEHQYDGASFVELNGASNVRILGTKTEDLSWLITDSTNILFAAHTGNSDRYPMLTITDSDDVVVPVFSEYAEQGNPNSYILQEFHGTGTFRIAGNNRVSLFRRGEFNPAPFDEPGTPPPGSGGGLESCAAGAAVTIDGNAGEWSAVPAHAIPYTKSVSGGGGSPTSDADSSASFRLQWDSTNLYVLVEVRDDVVTGTSAVYNNDSVELYLDGGHEGGTSYDSNDYQLTVDWRGVKGGVNSGQIAFTAAAATTAQGYTVEYAIPWSGLGIAGGAGQTIGLDVGVNDNDAADTTRDSQIVWHGDGTGWQNPSTFDDLTLTAESCQALHACRATTPAAIDGSAADWSGIPAFLVPYTKAVAVGGGTPTSNADLSATFRVKWDDSNLYALIEVTDEAVTGTSSAVYLNDGAELYLDGGHERASAYDANDYQLTVDWQGRIGGVRSDQLAFTHAVAVTGQGYSVEYAVPWSALRTPAAGAVVGLDVGVNDNDDGDGVRDSQVVWHGDGTQWQDPRQMGEVQLSATACP